MLELQHQPIADGAIPVTEAEICEKVLGQRSRYVKGLGFGPKSVLFCEAPFPGGPLTTRQPSEYKWMLGYPTPLQKIGQSLLCMESSTQVQHLHETCPKQSNIITMIQIWIKTASWAHSTISIKTYQLYPIVLRVQMFYSYTTYIKILEF